MALPAEFNTREVHLSVVGLDGTPLTGSAIFTTLTTLTAPESHTRIPPKPITLPISNGELSGFLPRTDDPDIQPRFVYQCELKYDGGYPGEKFLLEVPEGTSPLELANFAAMGAAPAPLVSQVLSIAELTGHVTLEQLQALGLGSGGTGSGVPVGGTTGQVLRKNSSTVGDAGWKTLTFSDVTGTMTASRVSDFNAVVDTRAADIFALGATNLAPKSFTIGVRVRTPEGELAPTADNWGPRPGGYAVVFAIGAAPEPADQQQGDHHLDFV